MSLLTIDFVKQNFPLWGKYFLDDDGAASETVLQNEMELADIKLSEYITITPDTITEPLQLHLLNIVRKRGFDRVLGDMEFEHRPAILRDYDETILALTAIKEGKALPSGRDIDSGNEQIKITAKTRRFNKWFNDSYDTYPDPY